jgi:predicted nucleotidyltransferase
VDFVRPVQAVIPGVQGRVLAVLAETTAELSLSTLARLADVSVAQASRVMPGLVDLGLVERREVPPTSLFRLVREHVGVQAVLALANARVNALDRIGEAASGIRPQPVSVVVFGSFARGQADRDSDIDVMVIRDDKVDEDDESWSESLEGCRGQVQAITGNRVELLHVSASEAARKLRGRSELWRNIQRDGVVVTGVQLEAIADAVDA